MIDLIVVSSLLCEMMNLGMVDIMVVALLSEINDLSLYTLNHRPNCGDSSCLCTLGW